MLFSLQIEMLCKEETDFSYRLQSVQETVTAWLKTFAGDLQIANQKCGLGPTTRSPHKIADKMWKEAILRNSRKFSPAKVSGYTV